MHQIQPEDFGTQREVKPLPGRQGNVDFVPNSVGSERWRQSSWQNHFATPIIVLLFSFHDNISFTTRQSTLS